MNNGLPKELKAVCHPAKALSTRSVIRLKSGIQALRRREAIEGLNVPDFLRERFLRVVLIEVLNFHKNRRSVRTDDAKVGDSASVLLDELDHRFEHDLGQLTIEKRIIGKSTFD
jgi:hypothetical protein